MHCSNTLEMDCFLSGLSAIGSREPVSLCYSVVSAKLDLNEKLVVTQERKSSLYIKLVLAKV